MKLELIFIMRDYHQKKVQYTTQTIILTDSVYKSDKSFYFQVFPEEY